MTESVHTPPSGMTWLTERRKVTDLMPAQYNPRTATEKERQDLNASLDRFNLADPIIINKNNRVIGGHFRLKVLKDRGVQEVDVRVPDRELTDQEERELNLRLNKNTGSFDLELLANFPEEMLLDVGFSANELDNIFDLEPGSADPDAVPAVLAEPKAKLGQVYRLGEHRLMCGDSTNTEHVEALVREKDGVLTPIHMVFTDPPYNVNYKGKGENTSEGIENDHMDPAVFLEFVGKVFENMYRAMVPGAVFYVCSGWTSYPAFNDALTNAGFYRAGVIIWKKDNASYGWNDFRYKHEWIAVGRKNAERVKASSMLYGWKKDGPHYFRTTRDEYDVWEVPRKNSSSYVHPTEKPVWLVEKALANSSQRYQNVLDLFGGSGSTLIACERLHRKAFLMEYDPKYVDVIIARWEQFTGHKAELLNV